MLPFTGVVAWDLEKFQTLPRGIEAQRDKVQSPMGLLVEAIEDFPGWNPALAIQQITRP